ncbi:O-antigen ligase family protein [Celeribacter halophilus]|uniref:O-antigen ligase family protein n=1 Tax=Celeribacter halophilus TaxID=576117 RepID=UPI003A8F53DA
MMKGRRHLLPPTFGVHPPLKTQTRFQTFIQPSFPGMPADGRGWGAAIFALFGLFVFSGSLIVLLTPVGAQSSPKVQALGLIIGLTSFVACIRLGALSRVSSLYWLTLVPILLTTASLAWSVSPGLTLRRIVGLGVATVFGIWLAERFRRDEAFQFIAGAAVLICLANVIIAAVVPSIGVHPNLTELGEPNPHAGAWRGLFFHKNDFGRMMALCATILWIGYSSQRKWRLVCGLGLFFSYLGVVGSTSGQAAILAVATPVTIYIFRRLRPLSAGARAKILILAVPATIICYIFSNIAFSIVLEMLGKDPTLTGRTEIWTGVLLALKGHYLLGGGFGAGWDLVGERLFILTGILVGHAHNGFLDLVTDLGLIGLLLMLLFYSSLIILSVRSYFYGYANEMALLGFGIGVFTFVGNWAASFMLLQNSLYWVIPVACVAALKCSAPQARSSIPSEQSAAEFWHLQECKRPYAVSSDLIMGDAQ